MYLDGREQRQSHEDQVHQGCDDAPLLKHFGQLPEGSHQEHRTATQTAADSTMQGTLVQGLNCGGIKCLNCGGIKCRSSWTKATISAASSCCGEVGNELDLPADHQDIGQCIQHRKLRRKQKEKRGLHTTADLAQGCCM